MKLKDLLAEGRFDMEGPEAEDKDNEAKSLMQCSMRDAAPGEECDCNVAEHPDACPGCGRGPGDGYGADCEDPQGCGYWKDFAREAMAELRAEMKRERNVDEGVNMFGDFMDTTLSLEEQRRARNARPVVKESYGHSIQRRFQELPQNRIRVVKK